MTWRQTTDEVMLRVPVPADVRGREVSFDIHPNRLSLGVRGSSLLSGSLADAGSINTDGCYWTLEGEGSDRHIAVTLGKATMVCAGHGSHLRGYSWLLLQRCLLP